MEEVRIPVQAAGVEAPAAEAISWFMWSCFLFCAISSVVAAHKDDYGSVENLS